MRDYSNIRFQGTFRKYQQTVLDNVSSHLRDKKIHIVAAPGSGKTILGLELIRRLNAATLIFAPSITIRQQWGERLKEKFLDENQNLEDYVSYSLTDMKLITIVTYQSLHSAYNQKQDYEQEFGDTIQATNYQGFDLIATLKKHQIKTICLDEAHHLRSEWQKSLEDLVSKLGKDINLISLTATPPYDSTPGEWNRYITLCGEIDEEIFIPELVSQGTLCPHQDYIYFNYPTEAEIASLQDYKDTVLNTIDEIIRGANFQAIIDDIIHNYHHKQVHILDNVGGYIAIFTIASLLDIKIPNKLINLVLPSGKLPSFNLSIAETGFQFIIDNPESFTINNTNEIKARLKTVGLIERNKVSLVLSEKLKRLLISSKGKLNSIVEISKAEVNSLKQELRMLILTDYIKKEMVKHIGSNNMPSDMGLVNIFEHIRVALGESVPVGVLSGTLIILPTNLSEIVKNNASLENIDITITELPNTNYSEYHFKGTNKNKVQVITQIFEQGYINILIGTKSLLGEGWDSPCINSLILASFVGSYMLSNQMRGRAIRIDRNNPHKTANIWHLVTIEPSYIFSKSIPNKLTSIIINNNNEIISTDYEMLKRRFDGFLAPSYHNQVIESGIGRIDVIKPPFDLKGINRINQEMLVLANNRESMRKTWDKILKGNLHPEILDTSIIPETVWPKQFLYINLLNETFLGIMLFTLIRGLIQFPLIGEGIFNTLLYLGLISVIIYFLILGYLKILKFISPVNTIKTLGQCILNTLIDIGEIKSCFSRVKVDSDTYGLYVNCSLQNATTHEKLIFTEAIKELLSRIDNPRYLIIKKGLFKLNYHHSFACPSIIGVNKETAQIFASYLEKTMGNMELVYTRNEMGRKYILKCRRNSYINRNENFVYNKKRLKKWQ